MSHHTVCSRSYMFKPPVSVYVNMGWDKPTQGYYMYIETDNPDITNEAGLLYDNLLDVGTTKNLKYFIQKLIEYKIRIPPKMVYAVIGDQERNAVNKSRDWDSVDVEIGDFVSFEHYYEDFL